jgi:glycosyltransferase involved in cell wall biosynthesis
MMVVSIVTPAFRSAKTLQETIDSVLGQSGVELEYFVVDGGSDDGTADLLQAESGRLTGWVSEPDRGQTHALNKGFARCTGEIVGFVNADDLLEPGALATVAAMFAADPTCEWVSGNCIPFGDVPVGTPELIEPFVFERRDDWLRECRLAQPSTFWRRSLFTRVGPFDETYDLTMDYEFWVRLAFAGVRCVPVPETLSRFRWHAAAKSSARAPEFAVEITRLRETYVAQLDPTELARWRAWSRREGARAELRSALAHLTAREVATSRAEVWRAVRHDPGILGDRMFWGMLKRMVRGE